MQKLTKKIVINTGIMETRVAILENGKLDDFFIEQESSQKIFGNIYKGTVESVVQGIGAAFVNIGLEKNGFLHVSDVGANASLIYDDQDEIASETREKQHHRRSTPIGSLLKVGQEVLVQIGKESVGTKGPRITTYLSIPGRYLVLTPFDANIGISKRITDVEERARIRDIIKQLGLPEGAGCIVRTAAKSMSLKGFAREIKYLVNLWTRIKDRNQKMKAPAILYEDYGIILRTLRDQFTEDVESVIVDSREEYKNIIRFLNFFMPVLKSRIKFYTEATPVFEKYGIEHEIEKLFMKKISLRNGGSIVIEQTEGMVAIDVNTEKFTGRKDIEDTVYKTNLEAAKEIARQIRLRDLGGIIIIDFIDMLSKEHRGKVLDVLETSLKKDKAKTNILGISSIGVVEMTRQRMRQSLESVMYRECPHCRGRGMIKSDMTIMVEVMRKIEKASRVTRGRRIDVFVSPTVYESVTSNSGRRTMSLLSKRIRKEIRTTQDAALEKGDIRIS